MPLNLRPTDTDFTPYIKYNAKAGRWYYRPKDAQDDVEVQNPRFAVDFANIKTGWFFYQEGMSPEKVYDPSQTVEAPCPAGPKKFKRGFEVLVIGNDPLAEGGTLGLREWSSTANNVITAINIMYGQYEAGLAANPGKVPFFACTGVTAIRGAYGTNYEPHFDLKGWIDRAKLPAFDAHQNSQPAAKPAKVTEDNFDQHLDRRVGAPAAAHGAAMGNDLDDSIPFSPMKD